MRDIGDALDQRKDAYSFVGTLRALLDEAQL